MSNPWEDIKLDVYEEHMSLDSVRQLQSMNSIMKEQFEAFPASTLMILGVAGGNGLEHIRDGRFLTVYGIDINEEYLRAVSRRYPQLSGVLRCVRLDIAEECDKLPQAELVIANLLIEYIGYTAFQRAVRHVDPKYVSCVIQINTGKGAWVSDSPYIAAFDGLDAIHHQIEGPALEASMKEIGYSRIFSDSTALPNGKALLRLDFISDSGK